MNSVLSLAQRAHRTLHPTLGAIALVTMLGACAGQTQTSSSIPGMPGMPGSSMPSAGIPLPGGLPMPGGPSLPSAGGMPPPSSSTSGDSSSGESGGSSQGSGTGSSGSGGGEVTRAPTEGGGGGLPIPVPKHSGRGDPTAGDPDPDANASVADGGAGGNQDPNKVFKDSIGKIDQEMSKNRDQAEANAAAGGGTGNGDPTAGTPGAETAGKGAGNAGFDPPNDDDPAGKPGAPGDPGGLPPIARAEDIPPDALDSSGDDAVARQLREIATRESDPVLRQKLWEEYRRYKDAAR